MFCLESHLLCQCISILSSISFRVSGFMSRSFDLLELNFVQSDKYRSIGVLLHVDMQFDNHHLLKMLSFFLGCISGFFIKDQVS